MNSIVFVHRRIGPTNEQIVVRHDLDIPATAPALSSLHLILLKEQRNAARAIRHKIKNPNLWFRVTQDKIAVVDRVRTRILTFTLFLYP